VADEKEESLAQTSHHRQGGKREGKTKTGGAVLPPYLVCIKAVVICVRPLAAARVKQEKKKI